MDELPSLSERQLGYVVAAVEEGSFTEAAIECSVSQPTLSASIGRLERDLGITLFDRIGRRIVPTDACLAMLPAARDLLRAAADARRAVSSVADGLSGHLDLAVQPTVVGTVVGLVAEFRRDHPGVSVHLRSPGDGSVGALVASGVADLGIGDVAEPSLRWRALWDEPYVWVEPDPDGPRPTAGSGRRRRPRPRPVRADRLGGAVLVVPPDGSPTRQVIDAWFAAASSSSQRALEVDHREAILALVAAGAGSTIVPASMAAGSDTAAVRVRPLDPPIERTIGIVHRDRPLSPLAARFVELAAERFSSARRSP